MGHEGMGHEGMGHEGMGHEGMGLRFLTKLKILAFILQVGN